MKKMKCEAVFDGDCWSIQFDNPDMIEAMGIDEDTELEALLTEEGILISRADTPFNLQQEAAFKTSAAAEYLVNKHRKVLERVSE
ncbi:MAG: hypothetical protein AB1546_12450 [bacterium]